LILIPYYLLWSLRFFIPEYPGIESEWNQSQKLFGISATLFVIIGLIVAPIIFILTEQFFSCRWYQIIGLFLMVAGTALNLLARAELGKYFTVKLCIQPGQKYITSGVYRLKHPGYIGMILFVVGSAWALAISLMAIAGAFYCVMLIQRIRVENKMLKEIQNGRS
jgi:isoprenylcysteine carboxyl methyltransferase (ICMT) family protein YpbQ